MPADRSRSFVSSFLRFMERLMKSPSPRMSAVSLRACVLVLAGMMWPGTTVAEVFDLGVEQTLLMNLLRDGKYKQALSEIRRIEKAVKPPKKNAVPGPATRVYLDLLIYRGTIERRMGSLDDADKTLTEAFRQVSDPAFQQFINWSAPQAEKERDAYFLSVELPSLQLLDNGTELLLERIRSANERRLAGQSAAVTPAPGAGPKPQAAAGGETPAEDGETGADDRGQIVGYFRLVDGLIRLSQSTRASLRGRFPDEKNSQESPLSRSPQARLMMSQSRPSRYVGMRYLEASQLPWTLSFDTDSAVAEDDLKPAARRKLNDASQEPTDEAPAERQRQAASQRMRAAAYLQRAYDTAEAAMGPAFAIIAEEERRTRPTENGEPAAASPERVKADKEAARIRAETLVPLARVALYDGDLDRARHLIDRAVASLREAEVPDHPELARPLIISAEVAFAESRRSLAAQNASAAQDKARVAADALHDAQRLLKSADSEFDPSAPLHQLLASQLATVESFEKSSSQTAAANSAADAAARRALAALKGVPKPAQAPAPPAPTPAAPAPRK